MSGSAPILDQGFRVYTTSNLERLRNLERSVANYAADLLKKETKWRRNDDWNDSYFGLSRFYADTNPLICPPGRVATGIALRQKGGNRLALQLQHTNPNGSDPQWLQNDDWNDNYFYFGSPLPFCADTNPLICPFGRIVTGIALRQKGGNRLALQLQCANPNGSDPQWLQNDDLNDNFIRLGGFYADANPLTCLAGGQLRGVAFYQKGGSSGNRVALTAFMQGSESTNSFGHQLVDVRGQNWTPARTDIKAADLTPEYPAAIKEAGKEQVTIVEASEELILTQQQNPGNIGRCFPVPSNSHLIVWGNAVCIQGKISVPGKHIFIFARELRTLAVNNVSAELDVSAAPLDFPDLPPFETKAAKGRDGTPTDPPRADGPSRRYAGRRAGKGEPGAPGQNGQIGKPGSRGGEIVVVCDAVQEYSKLSLNCSGGQGGPGQQGQKGGTGGQGGAGLLARKALGPFPPGAPGKGGDGGVGGPGGKGGDSGNCIFIVNRALHQNCVITHSAEPGKPGPRGAGGAGGDPGQFGIYLNYHGPGPTYPSNVGYLLDPGISGDQRLQALMAAGPLPPELVTPPAKWGRYLLVNNVDALSGDVRNHPFKELRGVAEASHLHMVLETARERYLQWDAYRFNEDSVKADRIKEELAALLDFLEFGARLLPKYASEEDEVLRNGIIPTLAGLTINLAHESDYFGHTHDFVPLGSPDLYLKSFREALGLLKEREVAYLRLAQALIDAKKRQEQRIEAIGQADTDIAALRHDYNILRITLQDLIRIQIPKADQAVGKAQKRLIDTLGNLKQELQKATGLTPDDFIECVFNLAFIGDPTTKHGIFTGLTTISSQSAKLISKAINTIPNDEGQPVNRKHILLQVDTAQKKFSRLDETWAAIKNARKPTDPEMVQLADPDAYRLLMAREDFDGLLQQFLTRTGAQAAMEALDDYVDAVQQRNAMLVDYNSLVKDYIRTMGDIKTIETQRNATALLRADEAEPDLPAETAFVQALYNRTRERCIENCYLASRAYRFWTMKPDTELAKVLKLGSPNQINYQVLSGVAEALYEKRTQQIQASLSKMVQRFPPAEANYRGTGICVLANVRTHRAAIRNLRENGIASFVIAAPTSESTLDENPFATHANVRINRVRIWVLGVKTGDGMCHIRARHKGNEWVRGVDNVIVHFSHEPVDLQFVYDWTKVFWNMQKLYVEHPDAVLEHGGVDGDLTYKGDFAGSAYLPLIGPFAEWEITLSDKDNRALDRSQIAALCFDFHGFSQTPEN
jgi:hypothetical protein